MKITSVKVELLFYSFKVSFFLFFRGLYLPRRVLNGRIHRELD